MSDSEQSETTASNPAPQTQLERGTYEIIRNRLQTHASELRRRLDSLNEARREVFGSIPTKLISTQRITTSHNCTAQDIFPVGDHFVFGYNVHMGLKKVTQLEDVFAVYRADEEGRFHEMNLDILKHGSFEQDFFQLYKYYKETRFSKFHVIGPHLYLVFQVGKSVSDIKSFKFAIDSGQLSYLDNRSDHEIVYPPQHDFQWKRTHRDLHRTGKHPHISIEDRVWVEAVGGDLTIKIEDNTDDGAGIYSEPVDEADQTLDDAEIHYSVVGNIILLKIRPFKEDAFRYLLYNEKNQTAQRLDSIEDACVLLPEDHGLIFSNGYYLQTGVSKTFESKISNLMFERRIASPNGEDYLYVFHNRQSGQYVLLSYNMIEQQVETPILCHGFSIFENGHLIFFRADEAPQKHHAIQVWQTPYVGQSIVTSENEDSYIFKIGNKDIVRAMAESHEILNLIEQEDSYANLYVDLVKKTSDVADSYFWLADKQTFNIAQPLSDILSASTAAVDEFDKVVRIRRSTAEQYESVSVAVQDVLSETARKSLKHVDDFVASLASLRMLRGQTISLKDLKYVDLPAVESLEEAVSERTGSLSQRCVEFLLNEGSLSPYADRIKKQGEQIEGLSTAAEARTLDESISQGATELEMLIDIVSNLKIDDATQRTRIIDDISTIYSNLNQTRARLKKASRKLLSVEGEAEFNSQIKLISQAVVNYLDICDIPEKCDEYLTKMMVQIEEIEGRFAEFDEFILQLAEKREDIYAAFDTKKLQLMEARNKRATSLTQAADRILKGVRSRVEKLQSVDEINSYFAADMMVDKVRDLIRQLAELDESVKVDEIQSRLKTIREDTVRQLRDRKELYVDGQNIIKFGTHSFSVNTQPLDLTTIIKDDRFYFHLSGTNYFERINHSELNATQSVWDQSLVSENHVVYRSEYLAYQCFQASQHGEIAEPEFLLTQTEAQLIETVQQYMAPKYAEGYIKGVHDHDAAKILATLLQLDIDLQLLKYPSRCRALANLFWHWLKKHDAATHQAWATKLASLKAAQKLFGEIAGQELLVQQLAKEIASMVNDHSIDNPADVKAAANYLFEQHAGQSPLVCRHEAQQCCHAFEAFLKRSNAQDDFHNSILSDSLDCMEQFQIIRNWVASFMQQKQSDTAHDAVVNDQWEAYLDESAVMIADKSLNQRTVIEVSSKIEISGMLGDHPRLRDQMYDLDFIEFNSRLDVFQTDTVPFFEQYVSLKKEVLDQRRTELRLDEFKPRVLTSFVRNQLINDTYLPMVGANLAKQIGVVGEDKRTDLMGLLLLVSPPGYGKTTLMEYIANRLGITFMKINGPAIGHQVTSLDPAEAPNASAREEIQKLNLALEMGDNVMIYVDDIQHCHPEFLQKFISLCDATRRIEGVFAGRTRTYDLRGRKVAVVMAGNPYTESGEKFQIPDMLASRADTYNLGDVIGDNRDSFEISYLENCLTSNKTLARLNSQSREDVYTVIKMAQRTDSQGLTLDGNYSIEEMNEFVAVMQKLLIVREVILKVNREYIDSAAQAEEFRTEPAFKLQGSYRDMNKLAEQISPIMNDQELDILIDSHYQNQAQTLSSDAQANLLKLQELKGTLTGEPLQRWDDIKRTFKRNMMLGAVDDGSQVGQMIAQMSMFSEGLHEIQSAIGSAVNQITAADSDDKNSFQIAAMRDISHAVAELSKFNTNLSSISNTIQTHFQNESQKPIVDQPPQQHKIEVINKVPNIFLDVIRNQFRVLQTWMEPILTLSETLPSADGLRQAASATEKNYQKLLNQIDESMKTQDDDES